MSNQEPSDLRDLMVTDPNTDLDLVALPETVQTSEDFIAWVRGGCAESFTPSIENKPRCD